jgi:hypothetical protein
MAVPEVKIKKQSFRFELRKRYSYEPKYRKVEKQLADSLKDSIFSFLKPKGAAKAAASDETIPGHEKEAAPPRKPSILESGIVQKAGGAVLLVVLLLITMAIFMQSTVSPTYKTLNEQALQSFSGKIIAQDILTASELTDWRKPYHTAYIAMQAQGSAEEVPVFVDIYDRPIPSSVFILRSSRYQAENYPEFASSLQSLLAGYNVPVNEIGFDDLKSIPSQSLVIVPSGYIPEQMLVDKGSKIDDLLARGVTVIYIGQPFDKMYNKQGAVVAGNTAALGKMRISFESSSSISCANTSSMRSPLYSVGGSTPILGCISAFSYEQGTMLFFPQTLDGGWNAGNDSAKDVYVLILTMPWLTSIATDAKSVPLAAEGSFVEFFTTTFEGDQKYARLLAFDNQSKKGFLLVSYIQKSTNGDVYTLGHSIPPVAVQPTQMDIVVDLREPGGEERLFLSVKNSTAEVDRQAVSTSKVALNSQPTFAYTFELSGGDYILEIVDSEEKAYARSYMRTGTLSINSVKPNYQDDIYTFNFLLDGQPIPLSGSYYINGNSAKSKTFTSSQELKVEAAKVNGAPLDSGKNKFTFKLGTYSTDVTLSKPSMKSIFTEPFFLGSVGIAFVALIIGVLFAKQGVTMYGLDIPDFPPQSTRKIPMKKETLMGIFQKINELYKWKNTPLKLGEVKGGFKGMLYEGKPIFISDYNIEYILSRLEGMGFVKKELEYYGLSSWEKETSRGMRQLAFFRKLRDICINNAVPFSPLGKEAGYDSRITVIGQDMYVHLYDEPARVIPSLLSSVSKGLNILVFEDDGEKDSFRLGAPADLAGICGHD